MAQRHEIEAWVSPSAWDDEDQARQAIDLIMESGSDDEAEWARLMGQVTGDDLTAEMLTAASRDYDRAGEAMDAAREALYAAIRDSRRTMSAAQIAEATGISRQMITQIVRRGR